MAVWASKAWMPRKSRCSASGGVGQRLPVGSGVGGAEDGAVGAGGPGDLGRDGVDAAEVGGGGGGEDLELGGGWEGEE